MKKGLIITLVLVLLFTLAGCGANNTETSKADTAKESTEEIKDKVEDTRDIKEKTKENLNSISKNVVDAIKGYKINYGTSELYDQKELDSAIKIIDAELSNTGVCTINSISYCGDEASMNQLEYCKSFNESAEFVEAAVFTSSFHTAKDVGDTAFNSDSDYEWTWYFAREADGEWVHLTHGVD